MFSNISRALLVPALIATATAASAQVTIDFEGATNPFSSGTLSTDVSSSGSQSLYLGNGGTARFVIADHAASEVAKLGSNGYDKLVITMDIYDMGKWIDRSVADRPTAVYGPRWGVSAGGHTGAESVGASIMERSQVDSSLFYGVPSDQDRFAGSWNTVGTYGSRVATLTPGTGGSNDGSGWVPGDGGIGAWGTWTFTIALDGAVTVELNDLGPATTSWITKNIGDIPTEIWLYGGRNHATAGTFLSGVYLDNITITAVPEPSTYALMFGAVALGVVAWRRRKAA